MVAVREVRIRLLGEPTLLVSGQPVAFRMSRVAALLGYLVAHRGRGCPRGAIAEALWPERDAESAHHNLRQTTLRLRSLLGAFADEALIANRRDLRMRTGGFDCDLDLLEQAGGARTPERLRAAVEAYGGPFLTGIDDEWAVPFRAEFAREFIRSLLELSDLLVAADPREALAFAERAVREEPFHDGARARKIRALRALGEETLALREFERYEALLGDELGLRPARIVEEAMAMEAEASEPEAPPTALDDVFGTLEANASTGDALRLAVALVPYWTATGTAGAGLRRLDELRARDAAAEEAPSPGATALASASLALSSGDTVRATSELQAALAAGLDERARVRALTLLGQGHLRRRAAPDARRAAVEALRQGRRLRPCPALSATWYVLSIAHRFDGTAARTTATVRRAQATAATPADYAKAGLLLAQSHLDRGDPTAARAAIEGAAAAIETDRTPSAAGIRASASRYFEEIGDVARARAGYVRAVEEHRGRESRWELAIALTYLGDLATSQGDPAGALGLHEEARSLRATIGDEVGEATSLRGLGTAHLRRGDAAAARPPLREAIRLYSQIDAVPGVASCLLLLAEAEAAIGSRPLALRMARRAALLLRGMSVVLRRTIGPRSERLLPEAEALVRELSA